MVKIITQDDLDPNGFVCTIDGKITPVAPAVSFACPQLNACNIDMLDGITLAGATVGQVLIFDGTGIVATDLPSQDELIITQVGHGFTLPSHGVLPIYMDQSSGLWLRANTTDLEHAHVAFVTEVLTADTFTMQYSGVFTTANPHGLTLGETYYLQDGGGIATTPDAQIIDKLIIPVNTTSLLLLDDDAYEVDLLSLPDADGTVGQVIQTDGAGNLSFTDLPEAVEPTVQSYAADFVSGDWDGAGPYTFTVLPATHALGATKYIVVNVYEDGTPNELVGVEIKVADDGTVTIESIDAFDGYIILISHV